MFTTEQVELVASETMTSTHVALATMLRLEADRGRLALCEAIDAVMKRESHYTTGEAA